MKDLLISLATVAAIVLVVSVAFVIMTKEPTTVAVGRMNASHILIQYKGSDGAQNVTRSKEEALEFAKTVREMAVQEGANFAELAKTHSDGPSGSKGGDLGNFSPDGMIPVFSDATQKLEIGDISQPVESKHGFHIILRKPIQ